MIFLRPRYERLVGDSPELVPDEHVRQAAYARSQAMADSEKASLPYPCDKGCGAPAWQLCYSGTGLPSSAPCPERVKAVSRG